MTSLPVALAAIRSGGNYFLQRRAFTAARLPGLWEFPGGKLEPGEAPAAALLRELREELGWAPARLAPLPALRHDYGSFQVELLPFLCEGPPTCHTALAWGWFSPRELALLAMPEANRALLAFLDEPLGNLAGPWAKVDF